MRRSCNSLRISVLFLVIVCYCLWETKILHFGECSVEKGKLFIQMRLSLKKNTRSLLRLCSLVGFDPRVLIRNVSGLPGVVSDLKRYAQLGSHPQFPLAVRDMYLILSDRKAVAGTVGGHYFHQDLWAAKKIFERRPPQHLDIGSRIDGFVAHLLVFMPVTVMDIRPVDSTVDGLQFSQDDATEMNKLEDNSVDSLSSLHAAEHFGLGRYSDPVDPKACFHFMQALQRVLAPGGRLYFSVPIGRERVEFNAHRVFAAKTILDAFSQLSLASFSFVGDDGRLYNDIDPAKTTNSEYGCGLFEFTKHSSSNTPHLL